ncbi:MAG: hypothetical protein V4717_17465 [Bacteroidota bacterium]
MKKLITSIAALVLFAGISNAAETTENKSKKATQSAIASTSASSLITSKNVSQIIEENAELRLRVEEMEVAADNMNSMLDYSNMMHVTISHLQDEVSNEQKENTKSQLEYARMMNATLINLNTILVGGK